MVTLEGSSKFSTLSTGALFLGYLAGALVFTWPLVLDLETAVTDLADPLLNSWALAWIAHQIPRDPLHLFDANIFYPERGTLAFSEHLVGLGVPLAPLSWALGRPVLTHNVGLLLSIALSGFTAARLVERLSGSKPAGIVAGSLFAFAPYRLGHLAHLQLQATGFLPLVFLCLTRFFEEGRRRHAAGLAIFLFLTSASCAYYGVFTWILLGVAIPFFALRRPQRLPGLALALAFSAVAHLPVALPYVRLSREYGFERPLPRIERASAHARDYLRSSARVHRAMGLPEAGPEAALFPGVLALGLAALAVFSRSKSSALYLTLGAVALWASLGPAAGLYDVLYRVVPGVSGLRVPARFGVVVLFATAVLGGLGASVLLGRLRGHTRAAVAGFLIVLPLVESLGGPIPYAQAPVHPQAIYAWLERESDPAPIVELPFPSAPELVHRNALYMLWSTSHWKPMANGYSALVPPSYDDLARALEGLPSPASLEALRARGIRYVIFHRDLYLRARAAEAEAALAALAEVARTPNEVAYAVR